MENRHDIISRINEKYAAMSKGHKAIATYIMDRNRGDTKYPPG